MNFLMPVGRVSRYYDEAGLSIPAEGTSSGESFEEVFQEVAALSEESAAVVSQETPAEDGTAVDTQEPALETAPVLADGAADASQEAYENQAVSMGNSVESVDTTAPVGRAVISDCNGLDDIFEEAAANYNLPVELLKAVAKVESNFNPNAVSSVGAMGVMQLMPNTARGLGVTDAFDARQNIMGGAQYLRTQLNRFGDLRMALAAYNTGPGNVMKYGGVPSYAERYVNKVLSGIGQSTGAYEAAGDYFADYTPLASMGLGSSMGLLGNLGGYDNLGSYYSALGSLGSMSSLGSLGSMNYYNALGSLGSLGSMSGYGSYMSGYGGLGMLAGGLNYGSLLGLSSMLSYGAGASGDTITMDRESFSSLIELMRIQMMMNAEREAGSFSLL